MNKFYFTLPVLCLGLAHLPAQVVLYEPFTYPDGRLITESGGAWVNNSGTTPLNVVGGAAFIDQNDTASREDAYRLLNTTFNPATDNSSTIYASFSISYSALPVTGNNDGSYFAHFRSSNNDLYARIGSNTNGAAPGTFRLAVANENWNVADTVEFAQDLLLNTTYTVVLRLDLATDQTTLWVDPLDESSTSVTATDTIGYSGLINSFGLRQGVSGSGAPGEVLVDELIVGQSFTDVTSPVPEPSTYAFIGLGLTAFWFMTRRRRA